MPLRLLPGVVVSVPIHSKRRPFKFEATTYEILRYDIGNRGKQTKSVDHQAFLQPEVWGSAFQGTFYFVTICNNFTFAASFL
jgi:hypothetical protein